MKTLIAALLSLVSLAANAQPFVEVALGKGLTNFNDYERQGFSSDRADPTSSIAVGYMFNRFIGVEAGYRDLGEAGIQSSNPQTGAIGRFAFASTGPLSVQIESSGWFAGPVFETYIQRVRLNARLGIYAWKADATASGTGTFDNQTLPATGSVKSTGEGISAYAGAGVTYMLTSKASVGAAYTRFRVLEDIKVNCWDVRLKYAF